MTRRTAPRTVLLVVAAAALLGALATRTLRADGPEKPLLLRLADENDPGHAKALDEWKALSVVEQATRLRDGLRSPDAAVALVAAAAADPEFLSLEEIRAQASVLARQSDLPTRWRSRAFEWAPWQGLSIGSRELPLVWQTLAALPDVSGAHDFLEEMHRAILPEHVPALVPLLEKAGPTVFSSLLWSLAIVADHIGDDTHRDLLAKAFLYGLARLRAERAGQPRPKFEAVEAKTTGPGLPPAFVALARPSWDLEEDGFGVAAGKPGETHAFAPTLWLHEWGRTLRPTKDDVPFLVQVAGSMDTGMTERAWAIRALAALDDDKAKKALEDLVKEDEDAAVVYVAAEEAKRGHPERFREILKADRDEKTPARVLEWSVDPASARARWLEELKASEVGGPLFDLKPLARAQYEQDYEVKVADDDLRWIADQLLRWEKPTQVLPEFFVQVAPDLVGPEAVAKIAEVLKGAEGITWNSITHVDEPLALLDAHDPKAALGVLNHWYATQKDDGRSRALLLLARVGDAEHVDAITAEWEREADYEAWTFGRVRHPTMKAFLEAKVAGKDLEPALEALQALAIQHGLPEELRDVFESTKGHEAEWADPAHLAAKKAVLDGDPVAAVLRLAEAGHASLAHLGLVADPRVLELLRKARGERFQSGSPAYWSATAGLAIAGDADARKEFEEFLRDGRIWMLDGDVWLAVLHVRAHLEWADFWVRRLESNCCMAFIAYDVLKGDGSFPTMPIDHVVNDGGLMRRVAEAWLAKHKGTFVRSRILRGLVPSR